MAKEKKNLVLRIDKDVMELVEKWASDEFRSTNGQLEWLIVNALRGAGRYKSKLTEDDENKKGG